MDERGDRSGPLPASPAPPEAAGGLLEGLNPAQREAVLHDEGPLLILAGAGTGKTRVITSRVAHLVGERGIHPGEILAITFTNKAAREMRERVARMSRQRGMWISTFHSTCARLLRFEIEALEGYTRDFTICDTTDRNRLIKELVKKAGFDPTRFKPAALGARISWHKNHPEDPRGAGAAWSDELPGLEDEVFRRVSRDYEAEMRRCNSLDFDDLLLLVLRIFEERPGVREAWSRRFRHVMVDEYQDTNRVQYRLVRHLAADHRDVAVCGDPDQSIYAWRGADVRNILDFERDFPGARVVRLEQNYRSTQNILKAAQGLISHNRQRKEKDLWSAGEEGPLVQSVECGDEDDEALEIARRIEELRAEGRPLSEAAIFYRVNFMQRALEQALARRRIPYEVVRGTAFFERREIKDLVAWLRLAVNPRDDEACRRALGAPSRGVGEKSLDRLAGWAADRRVSLMRAAASQEARLQLRGRARSGTAGFARLCEELSDLARQAPAGEVLDRLIEQTDYWTWIAGLEERDETDRAENVEELRSRAETYDRENPEGKLSGFLQDIALVSDADGGAESEVDRVSLMTLHTAKGLEFPAVFVVGLEEDLLPHARSIAATLEGGAPDEQGIEEERRLLYVGMTRAQRELTLTWARLRRHFGQHNYTAPSRFLEEIPPELIEGEADADPADEASVLGEFAPGAGFEELAIGDRVAHEHFGQGRVDRLLGRGINARATVVFDQHGPKQLLLQYAGLKVVQRKNG